MKYFIVSMTLVATVLSAEVAVAQIPVMQTLTTPGGTIVLNSNAQVPFNVVPAPIHIAK
jgi:hypothetical protein